MIELCTAALLFAAAPDSVAFQAYDARGAQVELAAVCGAIADADVVFLGERHDDATAHAIQLELLATASASARSADRPLVLALEMVETDVQPVLDEYLADLVRERDWLAAGRPWGNYESDYRPLVEFAKAEGHAVVGTNAPGRYVSLVSRRGGLAVLDTLSATARAWLAPVVAPPSDALATAFTELMDGMPHGSGPSVEGMLAAQNLRDASMAWQIAESLALHPGALVVHVNGSFHSAGGRGIPEHLARLAPTARVLVITMAPDAEPGAGDDFVIRTSAPASDG
ncbi:ChaN family lipoprotein [Rubrivirga sp. IMCC45206]|uniref:ChaN family lipoprotein n=1 Tax=Rubrivirga sp. IMCC45206 TaxID=3391614 RepID=UPI00398F995B